MVMNPNIITPKKYIEKIEKDKIYYEEIINSIEEENYRCHLYINELKKENNSFVNEIKIIKEVSNFHKKSKEKIEILIFELKKENEKKQKEIEKMKKRIRKEKDILISVKSELKNEKNEKINKIEKIKKMKKEKKDLEENFEKQREEKNRIEKDYIIQKRENNFLKKIDLENFELKKRNDFLEKKLLNKNLDKEESINKIYTNFRTKLIEINDNYKKRTPEKMKEKFDEILLMLPNRNDDYYSLQKENKKTKKINIFLTHRLAEMESEKEKIEEEFKNYKLEIKNKFEHTKEELIKYEEQWEEKTDMKILSYGFMIPKEKKDEFQLKILEKLEKKCFHYDPEDIKMILSIC